MSTIGTEARGVDLSRLDDARVPALLEAAGRASYTKHFGDIRIEDLLTREQVTVHAPGVADQ